MDFSETIGVYDLKLATDDRSDKKFLLTSKLCPLGSVCPLHQGYIHVINYETNCIKSDFKEISLKLEQMGKVIRPFCWHQHFVPWGLSFPAPGLHTCIKSWKELYKIRLQRYFFWNLQQMNEVARHFCWHQNFVPWGMSASTPGLYTCIKSWKKMYKIRLQRDCFLKLATNDQSDKMFLLTSKFRPKGNVSPCPGAIYMYKIMKKYCIKSGFN